MTRVFVIVSCAVAVSCQRPPSEPPCQELAQYAPEGVTLASDDQRCTELLEFGATTKKRYGLDFKTWIQTVVPQRAVFTLDAIAALTDANRWTPETFGPQPMVPCGGFVMTDAFWSTSVLSKVIRDKPEKMYVALGIEIAGNVATINVVQDFDCDNQTASTIVTGQFQPGLDPLAGGWQRISTTQAEIDE